jgi:hypothetical protein
MNARRTLFVFLSGCFAYASMAACSGGDDTQTGAPSSGTSTSSASAGGGHAGGSGPAGGGGHMASGGGGQGGAGGGGGAATGGGGGGNGLRLKRYFNAGSDSSLDLQLTFTPWLDDLSGNLTYAKPVHAWWDSQRGEDCHYQPAADGKMRCLPIDPIQSLAGHYLVGGVCKKVMLRDRDPNGPPPPPKYFLEPQLPMCPLTRGAAPIRVWALGAKIGHNSCVPDDDLCMHVSCGGRAWDIYDLAAEVDLDEFVAGTPSIDP